MCYEPEYELPESFLKIAQTLEKSAKTATKELKLSVESSVLVQKIAEQTGLPERAIISALFNVGLTNFLHRGIIF